MTNQFLEEIKHSLVNDDPRMTSHPIFVVQEKVYDYGYDSAFASDYKWINYENDHEIASARKATKLDELDRGMKDIPDGWEQVYYKERWEFVTACFTEQGCENYLKINGHNLREPRIYVESGFRNNEWIQLRAILSGESNAI